MTNKEAIEYIKFYLMDGRWVNGQIPRNFVRDEKWQAGELAIKALEERPQGEWIITEEEQGAFGIVYKVRKCSKCGWEHSLIIPDNYCSNCGADMRVKDELGGRE